MASIASSSYFPQTSTALGNSNNNSSSVLLGEELHDSSNSQQNTTNSTNPQQQTTTGAGGAASSFLRHRRKSNSSSHNSNNSSFNNNTNYNWANAAGICGCCCDSSEVLEYNYSNATTTPAAALLSQQTNKNPQRMQALPRIRERGEFYIDSFNDQPMSWSFGTNEHVSLSLLLVFMSMSVQSVRGHSQYFLPLSSNNRFVINEQRMEPGAIHQTKLEQ